MKKVLNRIPQYNTRLEGRCDLITESDEDIFDKYYRLYEYTDDVVVLDDDPLYPGLMNYVKTGILTEDEMIEALLK